MASAKCPVTWPRVGHSWTPRGQAAVEVSSLDSVLVGPLWRRCNQCGEEDRETPLCEAYFAFYTGGWPHYRTCGKKASTTHPEDPIRPQRNGPAIGRGEFHYCRTHDPVAVAERALASREKSQAKWDQESRERRIGWMGEGVLKLLREVESWCDANEDLVESDEWLGSIRRQIGPAARKMDTGL